MKRRRDARSCILLLVHLGCQLAILQRALAATTFSIIHYNDMHSRLEPSDLSGSLSCEEDDAYCYGGFARLATVVESARAAGPTLLLDAGDQFTGTVFNYYYRGAEVVALQNLLRTDAMTLGNHEFDYGPAVTASYITNLTFPVVTCNIVPKRKSPLYGVLKPGPVVLQVPGSDIRVGVVGWTALKTRISSSPGPDVRFLPLVSSVRGCVRELQSQGVGIIVGIGHAGLYEDGEGGDTEVAANVPGIDLVIGGHSHSFLYNGSEGPPLNVSDPAQRDRTQRPGHTYPFPVQAAYDASVTVPYYQSYFGARYVGNISLTFDDAGALVAQSGAPILLGGSGSSNPVPPEPRMAALVAGLAAPLAGLRGTIVGAAAVHLEGGRSAVRMRESNFGNLITDAMLWEVARNDTYAPFRPIPIALENGGGIRVPIPVGPISVGQVATALPFGHVLTVKSVTGAQLLSILSHSADQWNPSAPGGGFLQVAGLHYALDPALPHGARLVGAHLAAAGGGGAPILNASLYHVVTNDFTARGGDGFDDLAAAPMLLLGGRSLSDVVIDYVTAHSPVAPAVSGRIFVRGKGGKWEGLVEGGQQGAVDTEPWGRGAFPAAMGSSCILDGSCLLSHTEQAGGRVEEPRASRSWPPRGSPGAPLSGVGESRVSDNFSFSGS